MSPFPHIDEAGQLSYKIPLGELSLGDAYTLPISATFKSQLGTHSPHLGSGWHLSPFDSKAYLVDENTLVVVLPGGGELHLPKKTDSHLYTSSGWVAERRKQGLELTKACGWKLSFSRDGYLRRLTTPAGRTATMVRDGHRMSLLLDGQPLLSYVSTDRNSELPHRVSFSNGDHYDFNFTQRPLLRPLAGGTHVVDALATTVGNIQKNGDSWYEFNYDSPNLKGGQFEARTQNASMPQRFMWVPATGMLRKGNGAEYSITPRTCRFVSAEIREKKPNGDQAYWAFDRMRGTVKKRVLNGPLVTEHYFVHGPAQGKLRQVTESGSSGSREIMSYRYDHVGRLIRQDSQGKSMRYVYGDGEPRHVRVYENDKLVWTRHYDAGGKLTAIEYPEFGQIQVQTRPDGTLAILPPAKLQATLELPPQLARTPAQNNNPKQKENIK